MRQWCKIFKWIMRRILIYRLYSLGHKKGQHKKLFPEHSLKGCVYILYQSVLPGK